MTYILNLESRCVFRDTHFYNSNNVVIHHVWYMCAHTQTHAHTHWGKSGRNRQTINSYFWLVAIAVCIPHFCLLIFKFVTNDYMKFLNPSFSEFCILCSIAFVSDCCLGEFWEPDFSYVQEIWFYVWRRLLKHYFSSFKVKPENVCLGTAGSISMFPGM